jgi:hypothetical protein
MSRWIRAVLLAAVAVDLFTVGFLNMSGRPWGILLFALSAAVAAVIWESGDGASAGSARKLILGRSRSTTWRPSTSRVQHERLGPPGARTRGRGGSIPGGHEPGPGAPLVTSLHGQWAREVQR